MSEEVIEDCVDEEHRIKDEIILNLNKLRFYTINDEEIIEYIHWHCQKLLELSKNKNDSKEIARAINLNTFEVWTLDI